MNLDPELLDELARVFVEAAVREPETDMQNSPGHTRWRAVQVEQCEIECEERVAR
jgi:hypothetical protein